MTLTLTQIVFRRRLRISLLPHRTKLPGLQVCGPFGSRFSTKLGIGATIERIGASRNF